MSIELPTLEPKVVEILDKLHREHAISQSEFERIEHPPGGVTSTNYSLSILHYILAPEKNYWNISKTHELLVMVLRLARSEHRARFPQDESFKWLDEFSPTMQVLLGIAWDSYFYTSNPFLAIAFLEKTICHIKDTRELIFILDHLLDYHFNSEVILESSQVILQSARIILQYLWTIDPQAAGKVIKNYEISVSYGKLLFVGLCHEDGVGTNADINKARACYQFVLDAFSFKLAALSYNNDSYVSWKNLCGRLLAISQSVPNIDMFNLYQDGCVTKDNDPLCFAISFGRVKAIRELLKSPLVPPDFFARAKEFKQRTYPEILLHHASLFPYHYLEVLEVMANHPEINVNANFSCGNANGPQIFSAPFFDVIATSDVPKIRLFLERYQLDVDQTYKHQSYETMRGFSTPLRWALSLSANRLEIVKILLAKTKNINVPILVNDSAAKALYMTPLMSAFAFFRFFPEDAETMDVIALFLAHPDIDINTPVIYQHNKETNETEYWSPLSVVLNMALDDLRINTLIEMLISDPRFDAKQLAVLNLDLNEIFVTAKEQTWEIKFSRFQLLCQIIYRVNPFLFPILAKSFANTESMKNVPENIKTEIIEYIDALYAITSLFLTKDWCQRGENAKASPVLPNEIKYRILKEALTAPSFLQITDSTTTGGTCLALEQAEAYCQEAKESLAKKKFSGKNYYFMFAPPRLSSTIHNESANKDQSLREGKGYS